MRRHSAKKPILESYPHSAQIGAATILSASRSTSRRSPYARRD